MIVGLEIEALKALLVNWTETIAGGLQRLFMPELREIRLYSVSDEERCRLFFDKGRGEMRRHFQ